MSVNPYSKEGSKKEQVEKMFDNIAFNYDFLNHALSGGVDFWWRKKAISLFSKHLKNAQKSSPTLLDIATGTGDLAIALKTLSPKKVIGLDLSQEMLNVAIKKTQEKNISFDLSFIKGDSEALPYDENVFDGVCVAFGVRNFENLSKGLKEMHRVLNSKGILMILEFSTPENKFFNSIYSFYLNNILPLVGRLLSRDQRAYKYLQESVQAFPSGKALTEILNSLGFKSSQYYPLTLGICTIYIAQK